MKITLSNQNQVVEWVHMQAAKRGISLSPLEASWLAFDVCLFGKGRRFADHRGRSARITVSMTSKLHMNIKVC